jgi:hypothetical protein
MIGICARNGILLSNLRAAGVYSKQWRKNFKAGETVHNQRSCRQNGTSVWVFHWVELTVAQTTSYHIVHTFGIITEIVKPFAFMKVHLSNP